MSYNDVKFIDITFPGGKVIQCPIFIKDVPSLIIRLRPVGPRKDAEEI